MADKSVDDFLGKGRGKSLRLSNSKLVPRDISAALGKLPPQAVDLEETTLGAVILEKQGLLVALEILTPGDFYDDRHKEIFQAVFDLAEAGHPVDMRSVVNQLKINGKIELVGGAYYISELTSKVSSAANLEYHARVIQQKRILRDIILLAAELNNQAYEDSTDVFQLLDVISAFPLNITDGLKSGAERHIKDGIIALAEDINQRKADAPEIVGIPSGYILIDRITLGWRPGKLIIIAARPSMGKTTLALNFARNAAVDFKAPVSIFSLEMTFDELVAICVSIDTSIELRHLTSKPFSELDMDRFVHATVPLIKAPIIIDDSASLSITSLRTKARRHVEKYGTKMIIVDYIQLMSGEMHTLKNREQEIASISRGLKKIAKELKIPVIALSQLSREVDKRPMPCKPKLADLRESGAIEQDADIVIFPWRPSYYKVTGDDGGTYIDGATEIGIAKHRGGKTGEPFIQMKPSTAKFVNIDSPYAQYDKPAVAGQLPPKIENNENTDDLPF